MSLASRTAVISMPGRNSMPASRHAAAAAVQPATLSWSVTLSTVTPAAAARASGSGPACRAQRTLSCVCGGRSGARRRPPPGLGAPGARRAGARGASATPPPRFPPLPLDERAIFADEQIEVGPLFVGELEE